MTAGPGVEAIDGVDSTDPAAAVERHSALMRKLSYVNSGGKKFTRDEMKERCGRKQCPLRNHQSLPRYSSANRPNFGVRWLWPACGRDATC